MADFDIAIISLYSNKISIEVQTIFISYINGNNVIISVYFTTLSFADRRFINCIEGIALSLYQ